MSSDFIIHHASSTTRRRLRSSFRTAVQMWCVMMYTATGFSSSSMLRTEKTLKRLVMSTFVGLLRNPDHVPRVYFSSRWMSDVVPSIPERTSSKSDRSGGSISAKLESGEMSFSAYVSAIARSTIPSSSGVRPPSIMRKRPTKKMMFDRKTSAGASSSRGVGRSKGLMWCSEVREILK